MSTHVSGRLRDLFLVADEAAPVRRVAERVVPATVGVLATGSEGRMAATALALSLAKAHRARCAVVCRWDGGDGGPSRPLLAGVAARRLAERLGGRGLAVVPRGRLVVVDLPSDPVAARAAAERVMGVVDGPPVLVLVAGPRPAALDPLLATLDRLVVVPAADAPPGLEAIALDDAARLGRSVTLLALPDAPLGRTLSPPLRAAARAALGGDDA